MSFSRVNPGGWATGAIFTSTQANQIDIDHANAVDKTTLGDTISGLLGLASTAAIVAGISAGAQGMSGAFVGGSLGIGYAPGTTQPAFASGVTFGLITTVESGLALGGGATDWPTFASVPPGGAPVAATRGRLVAQSCSEVLGGMPAHWSLAQANGPAMENASDSSGAGFYMRLISHQNAQLVNVDLFFAVGASHASVPATLPSMQVFRARANEGLGAPPTTDQLSSTPIQNFPRPATAAAWYASGNLQLMNYVCDQNNVVDNTEYVYYVQIVDEQGSGMLFQNQYFSILANYVVSDMRFP